MVANLFVASTVAFVSTTIDDVLAVIFLYLERKKDDTNGSVSFIKVMIGQIIGFSMIVMVSLLGLLLGVIFPIEYIDLIGFIPLYYGFKKFHDSLLEDCQSSNGNTEESTYLLDSKKISNNNNDTVIVTINNESNDNINSIHENISDNDPTIPLATAEETDDELAEASKLITKIPKFYKDLMDPLILESIIYALLCGSDNISVYTSLFASQKPVDVLLIICIFYVLLGFNGLAAYGLIQCNSAVKMIEATSKYLVGVLLMALGIDILSESILLPSKFRL